MSIMHEIIINLISDVLFVVIIAVFVGVFGAVVRTLRVGRMEKFFCMDRQSVGIYLSGLYFDAVVTKRVVNAIEYDAAIELRNALSQTRNNGFLWSAIVFCAHIIGHEVSLGEVANIKIAPMNKATIGPPESSCICIGGRISNKYSRYALDRQKKCKFRYNTDTGAYEELINSKYEQMEPANDVTILEKLTIGGQSVFVAHGIGEEQTQRAVRYLALNWYLLYKKYGKADFSIRL